MTTQEILDGMKKQLDDLNAAMSGKAKREADQAHNLKVAKVQYLADMRWSMLRDSNARIRSLESDNSNLQSILDECDKLQPGIVAQAAMNSYYRQRIAGDDNSS